MSNVYSGGAVEIMNTHSPPERKEKTTLEKTSSSRMSDVFSVRSAHHKQRPFPIQKYKILLGQLYGVGPVRAAENR